MTLTPRWLHRLPLLILLTLAATSQAWIGSWLHQRYSALPVIETPQALVRLDPSVVRLISFGQVGMAIDALWIQMLQDDRLTHVKVGEHPDAYFLLDAITALDPAYYEAYSHGARALSVVRNDGIGAKELVLRGQKFVSELLPKMPERFRKAYWKYPWDLPYLRAYIELFDLHDPFAAAEAFTEVTRFPGAPPHFGQIARKLSTAEGRFTLARTILDRQIDGAKSDPEALEQLTHKSRDLDIALHILRAERAFDRFLARTSLPPAQAWEKFIRSQPQWARDTAGGEILLKPATQETKPIRLGTTTNHYKEPFPSNPRDP